MPPSHLTSLTGQSATTTQQLDALASMHECIAQGRVQPPRQMRLRAADVQIAGARLTEHACQLSPTGECALLCWHTQHSCGATMVGLAKSGITWRRHLQQPMSYVLAVSFDPSGGRCLIVSEPPEPAGPGQLSVCTYEASSQSWLPPLTVHVEAWFDFSGGGICPDAGFTFSNAGDPQLAAMTLLGCALLVISDSWAVSIDEGVSHCTWLPGQRVLVVAGGAGRLARLDTHLMPNSIPDLYWVALPWGVPENVEEEVCMAAAPDGSCLWLAQVAADALGLAAFSTADLACRWTHRVSGTGRGQIWLRSLQASCQAVAVCCDANGSRQALLYPWLGACMLGAESILVHGDIMEFSPDGRWLLAGSWEVEGVADDIRRADTVRVVDVSSGSTVVSLQLPGNSRMVSDVSWTTRNPSWLIVKSGCSEDEVLFSITRFGSASDMPF